MQQQLCIIIHGFAGNPGEVESLANALKQRNYEVITPLLPGHRLNKGRMGIATALDWQQMVEQFVKKGVEENKRIHLIGFSMGAMIASIMAYRYPVSTLILLSPAVYVLTPSLIKMKIEKSFQHTKKNRSLSGQPKINNQSFFRSTPFYNLFQFQKIVRQAKRIFRHISIPVCIIHGQRDETIDPKSSELIYRVVLSKEKELHYLPYSRHHICQDCEKDTVIQIVTKFLERFH